MSNNRRSNFYDFNGFVRTDTRATTSTTRSLFAARGQVDNLNVMDGATVESLVVHDTFSMGTNSLVCGAISASGTITCPVANVGTASIGSLEISQLISPTGTVSMGTNALSTQRIIMPAQSGTNSVILSSPTTCSATYTLRLPVAQGANGQILQTDGVNQLSFVDYYIPLHHQIQVTKDPIPSSSQYATIAEGVAAAAALGPTEEDPVCVLIGPGEYVETGTINVSSYIHLIGNARDACIIEPDTGVSTLFVCDHNVSFENLTISNDEHFSASCIGINGLDADNMFCMNIRMDYMNTGIIAGSVTKLCAFEIGNCEFGENVDYDVRFSSTGTNICGTRIWGNLFHSPTSFATQICSLEFSGAYNIGNYLQDNVFLGAVSFVSRAPIGIRVTNGASVNVDACTFQNYVAAIVSDGTGSNQLGVAGSSFINNSKNITITNAATRGSSQTWMRWALIDNNSDFYITGKDPNVITVDATGGDYDSVYDAIAYALTKSPSGTNRFDIKVGPGFYDEPALTLYSYINISGSGNLATVLRPVDRTNDFITISTPFFTMSDIAIEGPTTANKATFRYNGSSQVRNVRLRNLRARAAEVTPGVFSVTPYFIAMTPTVLDAEVDLEELDVDRKAKFTSMFYVSSAAANACLRCGIVKWMPDTGYCDQYLYISGPNCTTIQRDIQLVNLGSVYGDFVYARNGADINLQTCFITNFVNGVYIPNDASAACSIIANGLIFNTCTSPVNVVAINCEGDISGSSFANAGLVNNSPLLSLNYSDPITAATTVSGQLIQGPDYDKTTDVSYSIQKSPPLGVQTGGALTIVPPLTVTVSDGTGYLIVTPGDYLKYVSWTGLTTTFTTSPADAKIRYLYVNNAGALTVSSSEPTQTIAQNYIYLGSVIYDSVIILTQNTEVASIHTSTLTDIATRSSFGPIVKSGLIAYANGANMKVNVGSGEYWYSTHRFAPGDSLPISSTQLYKMYYDASSKIVITSGSDLIDTQWNPDAGGLATLAPSVPGPIQWMKNALYVTVGESGITKYFYVYGRGTVPYSSYANALAAPVPLTPTVLTESIVAIAAVIVSGDDGTLTFLNDANARFVDIRPTLSFRADSIATTQNHNTLLNLTVGDVHTQYLPVDGSRTMLGNLDMNTNNITNVNLMNGVDWLAHASRHQLDGADPLIAGGVIDIQPVGTAAASGALYSFAVSDHIHAHGNQTVATLHAAVTQVNNGFMSSTDKLKLDSATNGAIASTIVMRDGNADFSVHSMTFDAVLSGTTGVMTIGTNSLTSGIIQCTAITNSGSYSGTNGTLDVGTNSMTVGVVHCGAITSTSTLTATNGAINFGVQGLAVGAITSSGNYSGTNGGLTTATNPLTTGLITCNSITSSGSISATNANSTFANLTTYAINASTNPLTAGGLYVASIISTSNVNATNGTLTIGTNSMTTGLTNVTALVNSGTLTCVGMTNTSYYSGTNGSMNLGTNQILSGSVSATTANSTFAGIVCSGITSSGALSNTNGSINFTGQPVTCAAITCTSITASAGINATNATSTFAGLSCAGITSSSSINATNATSTFAGLVCNSLTSTGGFFNTAGSLTVGTNTISGNITCLALTASSNLNATNANVNFGTQPVQLGSITASSSISATAGTLTMGSNACTLGTLYVGSVTSTSSYTGTNGNMTIGTNSLTANLLSVGSITASSSITATNANSSFANLTTYNINSTTNAHTCGILVCSAITSSGAYTGTAGGLNIGSNAMTTGLANVTALANSGTMTCVGMTNSAYYSGTSGIITIGTNAMTAGNLFVAAITSSSSYNGTNGTVTHGTNAMTCGNISATTGTITCGTNAMTSGSHSLYGGTANMIIAAATNSTTYTFKFPNDAGTSTYVLTTDGSGNTSWNAPSSGTAITPATQRFLYDDFTGVSTPFGDYGWTSTVNNGTVSQVSSSGIGASCSGLVRFAIAQNNSRCCLNRYLASDHLGEGITLFDVSMRISTSNDTYSIWLGFGDNNALGDIATNNGIYFTSNGVGSQWTANSKAATVGSSSAIGPASVTLNYWYRLVATSNAAGTLVTYTLYERNTSGVLQAGSPYTTTLNTNLPNVNTQVFGPCLKTQKNSGTASVTVDIDYWYESHAFTVVSR